MIAVFTRLVARFAVICLLLALAVPMHSRAATSKADTGKTSDQPDDKADNKSDEGAVKSGKKKDPQPPTTSEASAEDKPDDRCDAGKQLVNFELRHRLCEAGPTLAVTETSEILGNLAGGLRQGARYEGVTDANLKIDLRPSFHVRGEIFARAYQIHGRGLSADNIGNLHLASSIEASRTTRLNELWYEQHFDNWRLRIGQLTIGTEFHNPDSARLFINSTFGWPTQPALDLPSGGPGYPLATPAVRVRVDPQEGVTLFLALFNGDPTGAGVGGSQLRDASGTAFRTSDGAWLIGEIRYNPDDSDKNGAYRFGGWWNSERFRDLRFDQNGVSLASPASNGKPFLHDGDPSFYVNVDQPLVVNDADHTRLSVFARAGFAPGDRNLVDFYADGGMTYKGPFGRADDQAGIAVGYAKIGSAARGFDADIARLTGQFHPIRSGEAVLELTYSFQLTNWWQVQPDFQYVFNIGGGIVNPNAPGKRVADAPVLGLRTTITF